MDLMVKQVETMQKERELAEKYLESLRTFSLPFGIKPSKFKVVRNNGFDEKLVVFCQNVLVDRFGHSKKLASVMPDMVTQLCKREGGLWHCSFRPRDIEGAVAFYSLRNILFGFKRSNVAYVISIAQIHK